MAGTVPLELVAQGLADATGEAVALFQAVPPWKVWNVTRVHVESDSTGFTQATIYRNSASAHNAVDSAAYSGNNDTTDTAFTVTAGEQLLVVWQECDTGARCTATISGQLADA